MGFKLFSSFMSGGVSPIAINFGSSSIKLLQIETPAVASGSSPSSRVKPSLRAAAELSIPDAIRSEPEAILALCEEKFPALLRQAGFRGRSAICTVPTSQTIIQHMQVAAPDGGKAAARDELIKAQLQVQMGIHSSSVVVRAIEVAPDGGAGAGTSGGSGTSGMETICFAMPRDVVMRYVSLLEKCKLEITGVHTEAMAMVRAFDHIHQRAEDEKLTTMYIDLGWGGTCVAIAHGKRMVFARHIHVGGRHFDELIASRLKTDFAGARAHRLSLEDPLVRAPAAMSGQARSQDAVDPALNAHPALNAPHDTAHAELRTQDTELAVADRRTAAPPPELHHGMAPTAGSDAPTSAANVDLTELLDTTVDELSMCVRYHRGLFPNRPIDRVVLVGGEARQQWLCHYIARGLRLPARLGDPLARLVGDDSPGEAGGSRGGPAVTPGLNRHEPQPGWAVPWGLCVPSNS